MAVIGVLASGSGSNFQALIDAVKSGYVPESQIGVLISDKKDAYALKRAKMHKIEALYIDPAKFKDRALYDAELVRQLKNRNVEVVCLAGYMRIVSEKAIGEFPNRVINIHPALLPSFPGLHGQKQALDHGVKISGCTVHFVDSKVDHGPIIIQAAVPVLETDTEQALQERILSMEHKIYPLALKWLVEGRLKITDRKVSVDGVSKAGQFLA